MFCNLYNTMKSFNTSTGLEFNLESGVRIIGLMSGTSLDGLDICYVEFKYKNSRWEYKILKAEEHGYSAELKNKLATAQTLSAFEYAKLNSDYGLYLGEVVKKFIDSYNIEPHFVASHGSTVFHQPKIQLTTQIGSGAGIAAKSGVDTICDFRTTDVALGGQGAPLVPVGDCNLFGEFDYCLNMGGFSNISYYGANGERFAYDISPVNYVLNHYMRETGVEYDKDGEVASRGVVCAQLLARLNELDFYTMAGPKSLAREWVEEVIYPLIDNYKLSLEDKLATFVEHIAVQISANIKSGKVLLTGGGAFNKFLVERMRANTPQAEYYIPDNLTVNFKEALIFAFLGALYVSDMPNCLNTVTGAEYCNIGGALYKAGGFKK